MAAGVSRAWASLRFRSHFAGSQERMLMVVEVLSLAQEAVEVEAVSPVSLPPQVSAETHCKI